MKPWISAVVLASLFLGGCCLRHRCLTGLYGDDEFAQYVQRIDSMRMSSGDAKEVNGVTQTDSPWPPYVGNPRIAVDGKRMTNAVRNYRAGPIPAESLTGPDAGPEWPANPPPPPAPAPGQ
jgi:hypothetical protein